MATLPAKIDRGIAARQEFGATELKTQAEISVASVGARERAKIEAMYVMAERHQRSWDTVRVRLLAHCGRPGFAEIARYKKPAGRARINGQWKDVFAEGLSARFAEIARMEAGNISSETTIVYEDDLIRIVRVAVIDVERNNNDSREITVAKAVEKRGKKNEQTGVWSPPEGREIISQRINSYEEPVWLVKATDDEIRNRQNSEISKTQRDESLRLIPKDIRDDCEAEIIRTLADPAKVDPAASRKRVVDAFASIGVLPDDLVTYMGAPLERISPAQLDELRGLYQAIRDGEDTFEGAMRKKFDSPGATAKDAEAVAEQKITELRQQAPPASDPPPMGQAPPPGATGAPPAPAQANVGVDWATVRAYEDWPDDPMAAALGLHIIVSGQRYQRATVDAEAWKPVPEDPPAPPRRPMNLGRRG
jgi:hypothetical protein